MTNDYIVDSNDDVLCKLTKENGKSVTLDAELSLSGYEIVCLVLSADTSYQTVEANPFFTPFLDYTLSVSLNNLFRSQH